MSAVLAFFTSGDIIVVTPGKAACDMVLLNGEAVVDETILTGGFPCSNHGYGLEAVVDKTIFTGGIPCSAHGGMRMGVGRSLATSANHRKFGGAGTPSLASGSKLQGGHGCRNAFTCLRQQTTRWAWVQECLHVPQAADYRVVRATVKACSRPLHLMPCEQDYEMHFSSSFANHGTLTPAYFPAHKHTLYTRAHMPTQSALAYAKRQA